jgi:hypothetical protein
MSKHVIEAKNSKHRCTVGWDRGMSTFFAIVIDVELEKQAEVETSRCIEPVVCWIGADRVGEVETVEALAERLSEYAEISEDVRETLRRDKANAEPPTEGQRRGQEFIEGARSV